ncbi:lasso peptide biosynthesis PqqD family chaperone [Streptomyces sp. HUAS TT7]|uniref:lasso peptide biosynthesis PqqD family chaperone n=1 Tax=Streptomyces sp. HUAS TT7 TaxID=3447507 RepID=UPI003F65E8B9
MALRLREDVSIVKTDYGSVLLDERSGRYFQLNPTGTQVAEGLLAQCSPEDIARHLVRDYDVTTAQAEADITALVEQLRAAELVRP